MVSYADWSETQDSTRVVADGHDLAVAYYEAGSGDPVVFLHGIPSNSYLWHRVIGPIAEERRVIAPDMVGYGNSSMYDGFNRSLRVQEEVVGELLSRLGIDSVSLVGHDLGGGVFLRYAAHNPDEVEELVLSNAVAYDSWPVEFVVDIGLPETARETSVEEMQETLENTFHTGAYDEADDEFVEGMLEPWNSEEGLTSLVRCAAATNTNHTTEIDPGGIEADTLLLWGADDRAQPIEFAERLEEDIDGAELVGLENAYHWVTEDRTEAYREELADFLLR